MNFAQYQTPYIVIGTGLAGLSFALEASKQEKVILLTKTNPLESSSAKAMGGLAAAMSKKDNWRDHYRDTLKSGDFLSKKDIVKNIVRSAPSSVEELVKHGVKFDQLPDGTFSLHREGGHSAERIVHKGDYSGREIVANLLNRCLERKNITLWPDFFAKDLLIDKVNGRAKCYGVSGYDMEKCREVTILSKAVILCTGGAGQLFRYTSNPSVITGDGYAMASRAGAKLREMAFVQFHPTAMVTEKAAPKLITEAIRGAGATLRNIHGKRFMHKYSEESELATRDIVSRAIFSEMQKTRTDHVLLDLKDIEQEKLQHFPSVLESCQKAQIDPTSELIPVRPVAHYFCGGIETGSRGETNIPGLFATGETACTGFHGANRLASNSLLEAWVMGKRCYELAATLPEQKQKLTIPSPQNVKSGFPRVKLQQVMEKYTGIIKTHHGLEKAHSITTQLSSNITCNESLPFYQQEWENFNLLTTARLVISDARRRSVNRGVFYNADLV